LLNVFEDKMLDVGMVEQWMVSFGSGDSDVKEDIFCMTIHSCHTTK